MLAGQCELATELPFRFRYVDVPCRIASVNRLESAHIFSFSPQRDHGIVSKGYNSCILFKMLMDSQNGARTALSYFCILLCYERLLSKTSITNS
jgi:hypothetical protein